MLSTIARTYCACARSARDVPRKEPPTMGRPKNEDYATIKRMPDGRVLATRPEDIDPDEHPEDIFPDYYYWIAGPPLLTDDSDPENLKDLPHHLAEFNWHLIREDYIRPKTKHFKESDFLLILHEHPNSTFPEFLIYTKDESPTTRYYAQLMVLIKCGKVIKQYRPDGTKIYSVAQPPQLPPKFSWRIAAPQIIICGHEQPKTARIRRLHLLIAPLGWNVQHRQVDRTYTKWNQKRLTDEEIFVCLRTEPGTTLDRLVELYRPAPTTVWAQGEFDHAAACMKNNLYRLRINGKITEKSGAYFVGGYHN